MIQEVVVTLGKETRITLDLCAGHLKHMNGDGIISQGAGIVCLQSQQQCTCIIPVLGR